MLNDGPIGIVGLGLVGKALAGRLRAAGNRVVGRDSNSEANAEARALGVDVADDLRSVASRCDIVFLSLPSSAEVDAVLWGEAGLAGACPPGSLIIDTTTADPKETLRHVHPLADRERTLRRLSAGGLEPGDRRRQRSRHRWRPGGRCRLCAAAPHLRQAGVLPRRSRRGHTAKLVVNLVLGLHRVVLSEGLGLANRCDLDLAQTLEILKASAAYSEVMETQGEVMLSRDFTRPTARLAQHAKDVGLILELAAESGARVPLSRAAPGRCYRRLLRLNGEGSTMPPCSTCSYHLSNGSRVRLARLSG